MEKGAYWLLSSFINISMNRINNKSAKFLYDEIDARFQNKDITAVSAYINSLEFPLVVEESADRYAPSPTEREKTHLYQKSDTYLDDGTGRVSRGLRGLELLSKLCKGVNPADLFLFNNVIYASTPSAIKTATREKLIEIVVANLGMTYVIESIQTSHPKEVEEFYSLAYTIGYQVRSGTFESDDYKTRVLHLAKRLTYLSTIPNHRNRY